MNTASARIGAFTVALVLLLSTPLHAGFAQAATGLAIQSGTQVRVTPRGGGPRVEGSVAALVRDTLSLRVDADMRRFALADLDVLEVRGGEDKRRGFTIGALIAATITAVAGGIDAARGNISGGDLVGTLIANTLIGGLVGYAFAPTGWQRLPLPAQELPAKSP